MFRGWLSKIAANNRGNVTMIVALSAVPLLLTSVGVLEITSISNDHGKLQAAADAGALAGAGRLSVATGTVSGPTATATTVTQQTAAQSGITSQVNVQVTVAPDNSAVTVVASTVHTPIVDLLGTRTITATAKAENMGHIPLCVLQTGTGGVRLQNQARIRATGCAVHANDDIKIDPGAMVQSDRTEAVGTITGPVSPAGFSGAMNIDDPFASMNLNPPLDCIGKPLKIKELTGLVLPLLPGVHCEQYEIDKDATLILLPGEHYFMNDVNAHENAIITGDDVVLIFGSTKKINFADKAQVTLGARKSGPFAGFLLVTTRDNTQTFTIASDHVNKLLGTIYIPNATLDVETSGNVAQDSAWSIIVAENLILKQNPNLVINSGYVGSGVPVPDGVGPNRNNPKLAQ
ncbi:pilus assembly protein TadG-related protein [Asticcacaulis solisilvae]|uniref:pilus assembly protein TadG-related protein n=1 Tax=Asticcacaulis solisilvae TaxID=1217274 RepID=UPI003FD88FD9